MEKHKHPFVAGVLTGCLEATINYPLVSPSCPPSHPTPPRPSRGSQTEGSPSAAQEYTKSQIQLTKGVYSSPFDVIRQTVARAGPLGEAATPSRAGGDGDPPLTLQRRPCIPA